MGYGDIDAAIVLAQPLGLEVFALPGLAQICEVLEKFGATIERNQQRLVLSDYLRGSVAEEPFGCQNVNLD